MARPTLTAALDRYRSPRNAGFLDDAGGWLPTAPFGERLFGFYERAIRRTDNATVAALGLIDRFFLLTHLLRRPDATHTETTSMTDGFGFDDRTADAAVGDTPTERVVARLKKLNADPVRFDFGDEDVVRFVDRQWERVFGDGDAPLTTTFETFRPRVTRDDAVLDGPVGAGAPNHPLDGFRAKKLLNRAAGFPFRPGEEDFGEVGPRVVGAIKRFQADRGLAPDGVIQPEGPTIQMLGHEVTGKGNRVPTHVAPDVFSGRPNSKTILTSDGLDGFPATRLANPAVLRPAAFDVQNNATPPMANSGSSDGQTIPTSGTNRIQKVERNSVLEAKGYRFVGGSGGDGYWVDATGRRQSAEQLRKTVTEAIRIRAEKEGWSAGRVLGELHKARSGLPKADQEGIQVAALWFLPFLALAGGGGATAGATVSGTALTAVLLTGLAVGGTAVILNQRKPSERRSANRPGLPPPAGSSRRKRRETVTVYRIENAQYPKVMIHEDGRVAVAGDKGMLFLNFGNREEAHRYFRNKILRKPHNRYQMKTFQVPKGFYDAVRSSAIDEKSAKENPEHGKVPIQVHQNVRGVLVEGQYGLPRPWILKLQKEILQGSGKVILDHGPRKRDRR